MSAVYHIGQRVSFQGALCTVRYVGLVDGTEKEWLGVEWDDPLRGKHDGELKGKRYFTCVSDSRIAASFVRPTRPIDPPQSFVEAVHQKYATEISTQTGTVSSDKLHVISGKVVEEVGFDKIRHQLARLQDLKIVIVDGSRINIAETPHLKIKDVCPKIVELDLSRNLFEGFQSIVDVCGELDHLRSLRINGNRLRINVEDAVSAQAKLKGITDLEVDDVLMPWDEICTLVQQFTSLKTLTANSNYLTSITMTPTLLSLRSLTLEYNSFSSLADLKPLTELTSLEVLLLKGNRISQISPQSDQPHPTFGSQLHYIDLSYNAITTWSFVDALPAIFPGMTSLRLAHNPVYENATTSTSSDMSRSLEEGYMLTLARLGQLKTLNFSNISAADRTNAEMYYLSLIGRSLAEAPESQEQAILSQHKRYAELVELYGEPTIVRKATDALNPNLLEARLIRFTFYFPGSVDDRVGDERIKEIEIPKSFDVYRVKGMVGRAFGVKPLAIKLIWETGEWDPVAGYEEDELNSDDEEEEEDQRNTAKGVNTSEKTEQEDKGKWMKREVEIEDGTRQIGFWVDGLEATVRVEIN